MALSSRDVKEMLHARRARRAVPQIDPADVVTGPEPEVVEPATSLQQPKPAEPTPAPSDQPTHGKDDLNEYAQRYLVKEDEKLTITTRMYRQRRLQIDQEMRDTGLELWQILDIGLELYFRDKQRKQRGGP